MSNVWSPQLLSWPAAQVIDARLKSGVTVREGHSAQLSTHVAGEYGVFSSYACSLSLPSS
jgi:hypothetical protein